MPGNMGRLEAAILAYSESKDPKAARLEWAFTHLYYTPEGANCVCGQRIKRNCVIRHEVTGVELVVGCVCVQKFLHIDYTDIFNCIAAMDNYWPVFNYATREYMRHVKLISQREYEFLVFADGKRSLKPRHLKILQWMWKRSKPKLVLTLK